MDLHHPIYREFPEHRDVIKRLKGADDHFRKMFDEYHLLDDAIYRIEEEIDFAPDQEIEELKMRRAKLSLPARSAKGQESCDPRYGPRPKPNIPHLDAA